MEEDVLTDCRALFELMRRFWRSFGYQMNDMLLRGDINVPRYMAMVSLSELGESTMGALSRKLHVTMGAMTNIVDKLIRDDYVARTRGTDDRRVVRVKLEPKGERMLQEMEQRAVSFMVGVLKEMEPARRKQFIENYTKIVEILQTREPEEEPKGNVGS